MYHYSKTTGGFYRTEIHGNDIPSDTVSVTDEQHSLLFAQQSEGKQIVSDADGYPIVITPTIIAPTWEKIKAQRDSLLQRCDWTLLPDSTVTNKSDWLVYRQSLRDIPQYFATPEQVVWPTIPQ